MVYSMVGMPLMMIFLANIGKIMSRAVMYFYSRCFCRWCRVRRKRSELEEEAMVGGDEKEEKGKIERFGIRDEEVGEEKYMTTDKNVRLKNYKIAEFRALPEFSI
jgi:hypothetical protein